jgi:hypothetical protein
MVLSDSCDIDNDDQVIMAECHASVFATHRSWSAIESNIKAI